MSNAKKNLAYKIAMFQATDIEDFKNCKADLENDNFLSSKDASIVATAMRQKFLQPTALQNNIPKEAFAFIDENFEEFKKDGDKENDNIDVEDIDNIDEKLNKPVEDETLEDEINEHGHIPTEEEEAEEGETVEEHNPEVADAIKNETFKNDAELDDVDGNAIETLTIEAPRGEISKIVEILRRELGEDAFDDEDNLSNEASDEKDIPEAKSKNNLETEDNIDTSDDLETNDADDKFSALASSKHNLSGRKANNMSPQELERRKAERSQRVAVLDNDGKETNEHPGLGEDTSHGGKPFSYKLQYNYEESRPTSKKDGSNSLKSENDHVKTNTQKIPTINDDLGLNLSLEKTRKEGNVADEKDYKINFNELKVPSAAGNMIDDAPIPTEMSNTDKRTTNVMYSNASRKVECQGCTNKRGAAVEEVLCKACNYTIDICENCINGGNCPSCALGNRIASGDVIVNAEDEDDEVCNRGSKPFDGTDDGKGHKNKSEDDSERIALHQARVKTAYHCATKLVLAQALEENEVDDYTDQLLSSRMSPRDMWEQTKLALRGIESTRERTAAQYAGRTMERSASVPISFNPSIAADVAPSYDSNTNMTKLASDLANLGWTTGRAQFDDFDDEDGYRKPRSRRNR